MIKEGVKLNGLKPELILAILVMKDLYQQYGSDFVITSVTEGQHRPKSLHYVGYAFDIRLPNKTYTNTIVEEARKKLGQDFDIVLEQTHIHVEYQPK